MERFLGVSLQSLQLLAVRQDGALCRLLSGTLMSLALALRYSSIRGDRFPERIGLTVTDNEVTPDY
jgi:hypothetical protein